MRSRSSGRPAGSESIVVSATRAASKPRTISGHARHGAQKVDRGGRRLEQALALGATGRQGDGGARDTRAASLPPIDHSPVGECGVGRHHGAARHRDGRREGTFRGQPVAGTQFPRVHERVEGAGQARRQRPVRRDPASEPRRRRRRRHLRRAAGRSQSCGHRRRSGPVVCTHRDRFWSNEPHARELLPAESAIDHATSVRLDRCARDRMARGGRLPRTRGPRSSPRRARRDRCGHRASARSSGLSARSAHADARAIHRGRGPPASRSRRAHRGRARGRGAGRSRGASERERHARHGNEQPVGESRVGELPLEAVDRLGEVVPALGVHRDDDRVSQRPRRLDRGAGVEREVGVAEAADIGGAGAQDGDVDRPRRPAISPTSAGAALSPAT